MEEWIATVAPRLPARKQLFPGAFPFSLFLTRNQQEDAKDEAAAKGTFVLHDGDPLYAGIRWYHETQFQLSYQKSVS